MNPRYDYIIAGAGCAGLSLACRMVTSGKFDDKRILITDKSPKVKNDRTWCFWETGEGYFDEIVFKRWERLWFHGPGYSNRFETAPYVYKMIRGIDFYNHCFSLLKKAANVQIQYGEISKIVSAPDHGAIFLNNEKISGEWIFNSLPPSPAIPDRKIHRLLQHFKGWVIETASDCFDPGEATLMDFRVGQEHGTSFVYIMPFSERTALVEYTLFTPELLKPHEYDQALSAYLARYFNGTAYKVKEEEFGVIPMTNQSFSSHDGRIRNIGMNGGLTKPSTGYTFQFIQKDSSRLVNDLSTEKRPVHRHADRRFHFYDSVLLNVLATKKYAGDQLFTSMFRRNELPAIFSFLDNESTLPGELRLISTLPFFPFLKAGFSETVKSF